MENQNSQKKKRVALGMSGGVDSSVAAYLLLQQGYEVEGFFMKFWSDPTLKDKRSNRCCSIEDSMDAAQVAAKLGIKLHTLNLSDTFKENIVDDFISAYEEGVTPNPCVRCNQFVKMGGFWNHVKKLGFDYIATGHYARIVQDNDVTVIENAEDTHKDQTYFLYRLNQDTVSHTLFPLADYTKDEIKQIAQDQGFITAKKKESQELCFLANNSVMDFLKKHSSVSGGNIIDIETEKILGTHEGLQAYTIGQRKGLGLGGGPWYVVKKHLKSNSLFITNNPEHELLFSEKIPLTDCNWITDCEPNMPQNITAKIRYNQKAKSGKIFKENNTIYLQFDEPGKAVTPGQSAVIYTGNRLLGGGIIQKSQ